MEYLASAFTNEDNRTANSFLQPPTDLKTVATARKNYFENDRNRILTGFAYDSSDAEKNRGATEAAGGRCLRLLHSEINKEY